MVKNVARPLFLNCLALMLALAFGPMASKSKANSGATRPNTDFLTQSHAEERAAALSDVDYTLSLSLDEVSTRYEGHIRIEFDYKGGLKGPLTIDFRDGDVKAVTVAGQVVAHEYAGKFIVLPAKTLKKGRNSIEIHFSHEFSKFGDGFYRFVDPEDKSVYVYTNFEPYDASLMFPCFDQPDLKATYSVDVTAPASWTVITSSRDTEVTPVENHRKKWTFARTGRFSTYIWNLTAGPFHEWHDSKFRYPLRLFARKSLAKYIPHEDMLRWTRQGFDFFEDYFGVPYPFQKYDQMIVPDFNAGAMENVGAVTFSEAYFSRGQMTAFQKEKLSNTLLHEMAHMWFGDLVTMRWWDDLWLNESFATFTATLAQAEATEFKDAWHTFFLLDKAWGMLEDQWPTTHPIHADVPDTAQAFTNFDGITYGKGASLLKQLNFYLTPETFKVGIQNYFKKFQYQNTVLADFMGELQKAASHEGVKVDLKAWTNAWLKKEGLNALKPKLTIDKGRIKKLGIQQSVASGKNVERMHRLKVGLYDLVGEKLILRKAVSVRVEDEKTDVKELVGEVAPSLVYVNTEDHAYAKVLLDDESRAGVLKSIAKVEDPHLRIMLWEALWDDVREGDFKATEFMDLVLKTLGFEKNYLNAQRIASRVAGKERMAPTALYYLEPGPVRKRYQTRLEEFFWAALEGADPGTDFQKLWLDNYVRVAQSKTALDRLVDMITKTGVVRGFELDQDRRWNVIVRLAELDVKGVDGWIEAERKRDPSDAGKKAALAAEVIRPHADVKKHWMGEVLAVGSSRSVAEQRTILGSLFPLSQLELRKPFESQFYEMLPKLASERNQEFMRAFTPSLAPAYCEGSAHRKFANFVEDMTTGAKAKKIPPYVQKPLRIVLDENERCLKVRKALK